MSWEYLFDSEYRQRSDIEALKWSARLASDSVDDAVSEIDAAKRRIAKLELTIEALIRLLETRQLTTRDELTVMIQRIDLLDGREDGAIGPDRTQAAPKCAHCARPLNPRRDACIYCGAEVPKAPAKAAPTARTIECRGCAAKVEESAAYITMKGLLCHVCYAEL